MNITKAERQRKDAAIRSAIAKGMEAKEAALSIGFSTAQMRYFMGRHGIPMPQSWEPRKYSKVGARPQYVKKGTQSRKHTLASQQGRKNSLVGMAITADPNGLTEEQRRLAAKLGIEPGRMAYLLKCPNEGNALGHRGGNAIG